MATNKFVWSGLEELKAQLRALPAELAAEAAGIVNARAERAKQDIGTAYPEITGNLRKGLRLSRAETSRFGVGRVLKNTAKHAWLYDNGSQARHWASGKSTGKMWGKRPPSHLFVRIVMAQRRAMYEDLADLLRTHGLLVTGSAGA